MPYLLLTTSLFYKIILGFMYIIGSKCWSRSIVNEDTEAIFYNETLRDASINKDPKSMLHMNGKVIFSGQVSYICLSRNNIQWEWTLPLTRKNNLINYQAWFGLILEYIVCYLMPNYLYTWILNIYDLIWLGFMAYQPL